MTFQAVADKKWMDLVLKVPGVRPLIISGAREVDRQDKGGGEGEP